MGETEILGPIVEIPLYPKFITLPQDSIILLKGRCLYNAGIQSNERFLAIGAYIDNLRVKLLLRFPCKQVKIASIAIW